jgi:DNA-binding winged helix-turn-helix (wHTH) protein
LFSFERYLKRFFIFICCFAQTISSLRRKLGDDAESPRYLITVYGVGYTLGTFTSYAPESRKTARALR